MDFGGSNPLFETRLRSTKEEALLTKRYKRKNKNQTKAFLYRSRNPQPNYSEFKHPQLVDTEGREYRSSGDHPLRRELLSLRTESESELGFFDPDKVSLGDVQDWGTQIFWIRIKKGEKDLIYFPEAERQELTFYDPKHQVVCSGFTDGVYHEPKAATGYVILKNFVSWGKTDDPKSFEYLVDKSIKVKKQSSLF